MTENANSRDEDTAEVSNNIMFQSSQADFAFVYPHDELTLYSCFCSHKEYGSLWLNVSIKEIAYMQGTMKEYAEDESDALAGGKEGFYDALTSGNAGPVANKWYTTFDDIMYLLQINEFKGASAGYSRINDSRYYENDKDRYIIDIAYARFQSAYAGGLDESINSSIYDGLIKSMIDDFKTEVSSYDYEDENIIALCLNINPYMGGAHGMLYFETINFSIEEDRILALEDLFIPGYDYESVISEYCRMDLIGQMQERGFMPDQEWIADGTDPDYEDTPTGWLISPRGLIMKFPAYQAAPYAAGDFTVIIPYDAKMIPSSSGLPKVLFRKV